MNVRPATAADIGYCERLDSSYATECVWQVDELTTADTIGVTMRRARIPRRIEVVYPRGTQTLYDDLERNECFLVADDAGTLVGYLDMAVRRWQWQGWIKHLIVHRPYRRQGIATLLMQFAERWARGAALRAIIAETQTKNDPATCLYTKLGFSFCGFIDRYYNNGDIGMLYSLNL
jgi:GNAT superfamily N-acetyltransferase